ncbi:hypothetical protein ACOMHN_061813 [Nucella lapillus]
MGCRRLESAVTVLVAVLTTWRPVNAWLPTYYMDEWCKTTLDLQVQGIEAAQVLLRPPSRGLQYLNCPVTFKAPPGQRISFRFKGFDIRTTAKNCDFDHVQIYEDVRPRQEITGRMCNITLPPEGVYTTTAQEGVVMLMKRKYEEDQLELIVTSFHLAPCRSGEFSCHNSHCIAEDLYCNDYDNCGDGSDMCLLNTEAIAAIVIAVIVLIIIIVVIVVVLMYRRSKSHHSEKVSSC